MNFRLATILFGLVFVLGLALVLRSILAPPEPPEDNLIPSLSGVKAEQIDMVEIERDNPQGILRMERRGNDWFITEPIQAKAEANLVTSVINSVLKLKPSSFSPDDMPANLGIADLQPPSLKITLRQSSERSGTVNIGKVMNGKGAAVFVTTPVSPDRAIAISRSDLSAIFRDSQNKDSGKAGDLVKWVSDFRSRSVFPVEAFKAFEEVRALKLSLPGKKKELALSQSSGSWKFDAPAGWGEADVIGDLSAAPNTFTGVRPLLGALTSLQALKPEDFVENPKDLKEYGLNADNPDLIRVEMHTKDGITVAYIGKRDMAPVAPPIPGVPPPAGNKVWVRIEGQTGVIHANTNDISGLAPVIENPDPLRDRTLLSIDRSAIDAIDITAAGQTTKLRLPARVPPWKLYGNTAAVDPQPANAAAIDTLLNVLLERRTIRSFPSADQANSIRSGIKDGIKDEIQIWSDGSEPSTDPKAEPKEKGKPTTLLFKKMEGDAVYVRRTSPDGTVADFVLPDKIKLNAGGLVYDLLPTVAKNRLQLLDPKIKSFALTMADRVTVTGTANFELEKSEKKGKSSARDEWTYVSPADKKGKTADTPTVEDVLRILGGTDTVSRFVDETPTPEKLKEYGLATPQLKVVVGLKGTDPTDKDRVYEFGLVTGDEVYARQPGRAAVFTLPKFVYDRIVNADLRNREIFHIDVAQVNKVEFRGWKNATGVITDLHFEKKDGAWTVTKAPGKAGEYVLDPKKLEDFLNTLSTTSVKTFVPGAIKQEYGFEDEKGLLGVNVFTKEGKSFSVSIGAPADMGNAFYVWTNLLPEGSQICTVDAAKFKPFKESPASLSK